jgi:hypothetical protein
MHRPHLLLVGLIAATLTIAQTGPQADRLPECIVRRQHYTNPTNR